MTSSIAIALHGLRGSIETLRNTTDVLEGSAALGSGAFWACALDEHLRAHDDEHETRRDADEDGRLLPGLRLVRNAVTHGAVVAVGSASGIVWPVQWPITWSHLAYRPLDELLGSWVGGREKRRDNARQDDIYRRFIEGNPVNVPLLAAFRWFQREQPGELDA